MLVVEGLVKRFGGFTAVSNVSFKVDQGEILGLIGLTARARARSSTCCRERSRPRRDRSPSRATRSRACRRIASSTAASAAPSRSRGRSAGSPSSRTWRSPAATGRRPGGTAGQGRRGGRTARSPWSACRPTDRRSVDGLGAAGLKKLELAKALATGPKLLLADESLGGLDETEMDQAADMLRKIRDELGITIIWVEHIMGVLMRVVDRVMVLDHGEKICEGLPSAVSERSRG